MSGENTCNHWLDLNFICFTIAAVQCPPFLHQHLFNGLFPGIFQILLQTKSTKEIYFWYSQTWQMATVLNSKTYNCVTKYQSQ